MIGGIFENISKTLGGGEKYFLELDDAAGSDVAPVKAPAPKAAKAAASAVKEAAPAPAKEPAKQAKPAAAEAKAPAKETASASKKAAPEPAKANAKTAKTSAKKKAGKKQAASSSKSGAAKSETAKSGATQSDAAAKSSEPQVLTATDLIVNAIAAAGPIPMDSAAAPEDADKNAVAKTFSTDYLLPLDNQARRQPGPGLSGFRVMAKSVTKRKGL